MRSLSLLLCACLWAGCQRAVPAPPFTPALSDQIDVRAVETRMVTDELSAGGNITADPTRQGRVGAPVAGRISQVLAVIGEPVRAGQPLARLASPELTRAQAGYQDALLRLELAQHTLDQRRQAVRLGDTALRPLEEARNEASAAQSEVEVTASNLQLAEKKLARARDLHQHGIATTQEVEEATAAREQAESRHQQSLRQIAVAHKHRQREQRLAENGALIAPRILEAENEFKMAREEVTHSAGVLLDLGKDPQDARDGLELRSPRAGLLVSSQAVLGESVTADQALFEVLDPSRLWLWISVFERDQARVRTGMRVHVQVEAYPGKRFSGRISYIPPQVELPSRALRCRVVVENPRNLLKVGMAATVRLTLNPAHRALIIPPTALLPGGFVYVQAGASYEKRPVVTGAREPEWVEVKSGLRAGDRVVVAGADLLAAGGAP